LLCLVLSSTLASWAHNHSAKPVSDLAETASTAGTFETLLAAAETAGLVGALKGSDQLTVFAPTDDAFNALPKGTVASLLKPENREQLASLLKFHIVAGKVGSAELEDGLEIEMLSGQVAAVAAAEQGFIIQGARIVTPEVSAANGVIHVIDRVIMPAKNNAQAAITQIDRAINRGAPLFNHGNPEATVALYRFTAETLLEGGMLDQRDSTRLMKVLRQSSRSHDSTENAWDLRYALDDVRKSLMGDMRMTMTTY
jgi:transforming growth factor-beta-induced protein